MGKEGKGLKAGCSSKQEISMRWKDGESKNRQMGKDNCIWGTKEAEGQNRISEIQPFIAFALSHYSDSGISQFDSQVIFKSQQKGGEMSRISMDTKEVMKNTKENLQIIN